MRDSHCVVSVETEKVWAEFQGKLLGFIRKRVGDAAVAEDILQDVFIKVHRNMDSLKRGDKLESWVYQIARNTIIDHYRTQKRLVDLPDDLVATDGETVESAQHEMTACLTSLLDHLPEKYASAVRLCDIEGMSQKEIADMENLSLSGAKSRIQRGRAQLKALLHDCCRCKSMNRSQFTTCMSDGKSCDKC